MDLDAFTKDELREINDALNDAVLRMLKDGQTSQEREYASLAVAWDAQKKVVSRLLGATPPGWLTARDVEVKARAGL